MNLFKLFTVTLILTAALCTSEDFSDHDAFMKGRKFQRIMATASPIQGIGVDSTPWRKMRIAVNWDAVDEFVKGNPELT